MADWINKTRKKDPWLFSFGSFRLGCACVIMPGVGLIGRLIGIFFGIIGFKTEKQMAIIGIFLNILAILVNVIIIRENIIPNTNSN